MSTPSTPGATDRPTTWPSVNYQHLRHMSDPIGLFEHAQGSEPRKEHGYCVDDVARGLVVLSREPRSIAEAEHLLPRYLDFVLASQSPSGLVINRRGVDGRWNGRPSVGDWWGRAIWGLGSVAARSRDESMRRTALRAAEQGLHLRPPYLASMVFASLGAAEVVSAEPGHRQALALLRDTADLIGTPTDDPEWRWPRERLTYANAAVAEVLIAAGEHLPGTDYLDHGLELLTWLLAFETRAHHLSLTPSGGADRTLRKPAYDQQPIEAAALADACARASRITGDIAWTTGVERAAAWFMGANDLGLTLYNPNTGGGFDGLRSDGVNVNQGAESTLAALSTMQQAHRVARSPYSP